MAQTYTLTHMQSVLEFIYAKIHGLFNPFNDIINMYHSKNYQTACFSYVNTSEHIITIDITYLQTRTCR